MVCWRRPGSIREEGAEDDDPAFVIAPVTAASRFWIGRYSSRQTYAFHTDAAASGVKGTELIGDQEVVTLLEGADSGMTMSWMNVPSGGTVAFRFSVGDVANTGAVRGKVDYKREMLTGLDPNTVYEITVDNTKYTVTSNGNGEVPLSGYDNNSNPYDFVGKSLTIAKKDSEDTPAQIEVEGRPTTPEQPTDLDENKNATPSLDEKIEIVELTTTSVTVSPVQGQQYAYSTDNVNWTVLTDTNTNVDGNYLIKDLQQGPDVYIRTRVAATNQAPASQWSAAKKVTLMSTVNVSASVWSGSYDGTNHKITVTSTTEGAQITYSSSPEVTYNATNPEFKNAGFYTVYYRVTADGCYPVCGSTYVYIGQKRISVSDIVLNEGKTLKDVELSGLIDGEQLTKDTDYTVSSLNISTDTRYSTASVYAGLRNTTAANNYRLNTNGQGVCTVSHTHTWNYKVDDTSENVIKAYCSGTSHSEYCPYYGEEHAVSLSLSADNVTYTGGSYTGSHITNGISSVTGPTTSGITYYESTGVGSTTIQGSSLTPINVGNYVAVYTITHTGATGSPVQAKAAFQITPATISDDDVTLSSDTLVFDGEEQGPDVTVKVNGTTLQEDRDYIISGDEAAIAPGDSYIVTIQGQGNYQGTVEKTWKITDESAPTGTIEISENTWNTLLSGVTFDLFFKNTQVATITAADEGSGVDKVFYYVANEELPEAEVLALEEEQWTQGNTVAIDPDQQYVVYAKITDKSGNVTYISSNGVVLDATNPAISGVTDGKIYCHEQTITVVDANLDKVLVNGEEVTLTDSTYTLTADGTTYVIKAVDKAGNEDNVTVTVNDGHTPEIDVAIAATCTEDGLTEGSHCEVCGELLVAQEVVSALGHDWSGEWKLIKEATATEEGKEETTCTRGCGQKKVRTIPAIGTTDELPESVTGTLEKDAEVAKDAPITAATIDNQKKELFNATAIFTDAEKQSIENGSDARVWLEIGKTDESSISTEDKAKLIEEAQKIMGADTVLIYFDADLFKQVEGSSATQIHEPGIPVKVTIQIPDTLLNQNKIITREYKIIRLHTDVATGESQVDVLDGTFDEATGEFSFETDMFSTFTIVYTDTQLVTGVTLDKSEGTINQKGGSLQLTAIVAPANAANKDVTWTTSNASVATVDANGKVTAVANGTCTITVTTADGGFTATCTIKVDIPADTNTDNNNTTATVTAPKTGDDSKLALYFLLLLLSITAMTGVAVRRKRNR